MINSFRLSIIIGRYVKASIIIPDIRCGLTGYDARYAALAEDLNGIWLTFDKKAHRLIQQHNISFLLEKEMPTG